MNIIQSMKMVLSTDRHSSIFEGEMIDIVASETSIGLTISVQKLC